jgi:hypothetical protein
MKSLQREAMNKRYANTSGVPLSLAVFLASDYYDYNDDPHTISVTTLLKPTRQIVLAKRLPPDNGPVDLAAQMSNRLGAAMHDGIERAWQTNYVNAMLSLGIPQRVVDLVRINPTDAELLTNPDIIPVYMEQRMQKKIGKWTVTGKFDFIGEGRVQDFKSASVWSYMNQVNAWKQIMQGSLYRWLDPKKITQDQMDIIHVFMDWRASQVASEPNYPKQRFATQTLNLIPYNDTDAWVKAKLADIDRCMNLPEVDLEECDEDALWRSKTTYKYYANGVAGAKKSSKNFTDLTDANNYKYHEKGGKGDIVTVHGQVKGCNYCGAYPICSQKDRLIASGHLLKQI